MRAHTKKKHEIRKRFAIVIGVAAAGVMALGAQTGAQSQAPTPRGQAPPTCKGKPATIVITEGNEGLAGYQARKGTAGRDVIVGLGGNERIGGRGGNDLICGRDGLDVIAGGPGNDTLLGQAHWDLLRGMKGNDTLLGQAGGDVFMGGPGKDLCNGGKGRDIAATMDQTPPDEFLCEVEKSIARSGVQIH